MQCLNVLIHVHTSLLSPLGLVSMILLHCWYHTSSLYYIAGNALLCSAVRCQQSPPTSIIDATCVCIDLIVPPFIDDMSCIDGEETSELTCLCFTLLQV